ncbi:MAG: DUF3108 domain-containing protein [Magnetococcales bacterium]|nr:DUF3108 domain-containing protein [Magnetococcales bacterium]
MALSSLKRFQLSELRFAWLVMVCVIITALLPSLVRAEEAHPPGPAFGERLTYSIRWGVMPAGAAVMNFLPYDGPGAYTIQAHVESIGMVAMMHPVDDHLKTIGYRQGGRLFSTMFKKDQRERNRITRYRFERNRKQVVRRVDKKKPLTISNIPYEISDPFSTFYTLRSHPEFKEGETITIPYLDGEKTYKAIIKVGKEERLYTPMGYRDVFAVYPTLESSDKFKEHGKLVIWLSKDERRLPVKVEAHVSIGTLAADLVEYEDGLGGKGKIVAQE